MNKATALPLLMSANVVARQWLMRPNVLANKNKTFQLSLLMPHTRWGLAACSLLLIRHIYVNWGGFLSSRSWTAPSLSLTLSCCLLLLCSINWKPADKREGTLELGACAHSLCQLSCLIKAHFGSPLIFGFWLSRAGGVSFRLTRATPGKSLLEYFSFVTQSQDNLGSPSPSWKLHYPWWHPAWWRLLLRLTSADGVTIVSAPGDTCPHILNWDTGHHEWGGNVSQSSSPGSVSRILTSDNVKTPATLTAQAGHRPQWPSYHQAPVTTFWAQNFSLG